jgi:hypothetical protein
MHRLFRKAEPMNIFTISRRTIATCVCVAALAAACSSDAAGPAVTADTQPAELALADDSSGATTPLTEADLPDGVDNEPSAEELEAEGLIERPDVEPGVLAVENADVALEARMIDGVFTGSTGTVEIPLGSMVAYSVITPLNDNLVIEGYDLSVPTNGDIGQLLFVADTAGTFVVALEAEGLVVAEFVVG